MVTERELRMGKQIFETRLYENLNYLVKTGRHINKIDWNENEELLSLAMEIVDLNDAIEDMVDTLEFNDNMGIRTIIQMEFGQDLFDMCSDGIELEIDSDILDMIYDDDEYRFSFYDELSFKVSEIDYNIEQLKEIIAEKNGFVD